MSISFESFRHSHRNDIFNIRFRGHSRASRLKVNIAHRARICPLTPCRSYLHVCQFPLVERRKQQFHASLAGCVGSVKKDTTRDSSAAVTSDLVPVSPLFFFLFFCFSSSNKTDRGDRKISRDQEVHLTAHPSNTEGKSPHFFKFCCRILHLWLCRFARFHLLFFMVFSLDILFQLIAPSSCQITCAVRPVHR